MKYLLTACIASMFLLLPACEGLDGLFGDDDENWSAWGYGEATADGWWMDDMGEPIDASNGELSGNYGEVDVPEAVPADVSGWDDGGFARVEVMAYSDDGVSMAILEVFGGLDHEQLQPGSTHTFNAEDMYYGSSDRVDVMVTGCAGQEAFEWMYDDMAREVEVEVSADADDPNLRTYTFTADFQQYDWSDDTYSGETTTLTGSFQAHVGEGQVAE